MIGIRADGNSKIGMGHLMRSLSIAEEFAKEGCKVIFFVADDSGAGVVMERGFDCRVLGTDYSHMEEELDCLTEGIKREKIELLLVDSYYVTENYMASLNEVCPVFYIDDMGERFFPVSGLINYNIYGPELPYAQTYGQDTLLLLGAQYAPVREEFRKTLYKIKERTETVLITMGGSDKFNISGRLCEEFLLHLPEEIHIKIVCGKFNEHCRYLKELEARENRVEVLVDVKDMWNCLADADVVVAAAGSTMYELATMGIPTVCCYYVDNQRRIAEGFKTACGMVNAGDYSLDQMQVAEEIMREVMLLTGDVERRRRLSEAMKKVTQGDGARNVVLCLKRYMEERNEK